MPKLPRLFKGGGVMELIGTDRDWICFDRRGGGLSTPLLSCWKQPARWQPASDRAGWLERIDRHRQHATPPINYNVPLPWHLTQSMLRIKPRRGDLGRVKVAVSPGTGMTGDKQGPRELPAGHGGRGQYQVGHRAGKDRVDV